jgi:Domain of unknown function (DUF3482)
VRLLGQRLGGTDLVVGPVTAANFPWVLLGRALLHHRVVSERNHARREALVVDVAEGAHLTDAIDTAVRRRLEGCFRKLRAEREVDAATRMTLRDDIESLLVEQERAHP